MVAIVDSYSAEYAGAYSHGGFMKAHRVTGASMGWEQLQDPSGHMPRLANGGDIQFVRIMIPVPKGSTGGPPAVVNLVAEYQGTGGAELWAANTGATGTTAGDAWPRFQLTSPSGATGPYTFYVEYGRVHSVPR